MYQVFSLNSKESAFRNNDSTIPWLLSAWKCDVLLHQRTLIKNNIKKKRTLIPGANDRHNRHDDREVL